MEAPPAIGTDERRMHVRAYNYWVSLLDGRDYPSIEDLEPANLSDFAAHSVLLDFTGGREDPATSYIGAAVREECGLADNVQTISDIPSRSLLSRLTDHYLQIIANCAPIGFEAEFVGRGGAATMYRGILMPLSSDGDTIDFIYGVINWKKADQPKAEPAAPVPEMLVEPEPEPEPQHEMADAVDEMPAHAHAEPEPGRQLDRGDAQVLVFVQPRRRRVNRRDGGEGGRGVRGLRVQRLGRRAGCARAYRGATGAAPDTGKGRDMDWFDGGWDERLARTRAAAAGIEEAGGCLAPLGTLRWESPAGRAFRVQLELLTAQVRYLSGIVEAAEAARPRRRPAGAPAVQIRHCRRRGARWPGPAPGR